ncbi:rod shape-determining protein [Anaerococcus sp. mt242]|uniref:rod shape-determining protein n=1 Tax=Anaerococcus sp. mt242 TaxID=2661917 RepID=UPI001933F368|nr:rod shape-determining protein [Anaerococcus sp. mt242]MBM0045931.1 rod shape-determining protein [Anaerococcus sp. mt242]
MNLRMVATDFAIDLGTSNILVYKKNEGVIINEPSMIVLDQHNTKVLAIGQEAKDMIGKTPSSIHVVKPIENGVITDFNLTEAMLKHFFNQVNPGTSIFQPKVVICVPSGITDIESRAIEDAALHAGSRDIILVDESLAAAFGMGLTPEDPKGIMLLNLGAGTSEVSVISLNGVVTSKTINKGGDYIDDAIIDLFRDKKRLDIGRQTAEDIKINLLSLRIKDGETSITVDGRDLLSAAPKTVDIKSKDLVECIMPYADEIVNMIYEVLEKVPPELTADIKKDGFGLTGGLSQIRGLREYIEHKLNLSSYISDNPETDAILGAGKILEDPDRFFKYRK